MQRFKIRIFLISLLISAIIIILFFLLSKPFDGNRNKILKNGSSKKTGQPQVSVQKKNSTTTSNPKTGPVFKLPNRKPTPRSAPGDLNSTGETEKTTFPELPPGLDPSKNKKNNRAFILAAFDLNDDGQPDLVVFEKKELVVSQVLISEGKGSFKEAPDLGIPDYLKRFLVLSVNNGMEDSDKELSIRDEKGKEHDLLIMGDNKQ